MQSLADLVRSPSCEKVGVGLVRRIGVSGSVRHALSLCPALSSSVAECATALEDGAVLTTAPPTRSCVFGSLPSNGPSAEQVSYWSSVNAINPCNTLVLSRMVRVNPLPLLNSGGFMGMRIRAQLPSAANSFVA